MTSAKSSPPNKPTEIQEEIEDLCEWLQDEDNIIGCTILFQKKYGEASAQFKLLRSDFCLIVATNKRRLLHEHGVRTLCLDRIPWNRSDDLSITALFVVDTCGFEHTVAFMLSDRSDAYIYEVFFTKLRKYLEEAQPEVVLTPVSQSVFSAFRNATKNEAAKGAFSPWQVDESWRGQLRLIKKAEKRKEVYKALRGLQLESDAAEFDEAYARLLDELKSDPATKEFCKTWLKTFHKTLASWASCLRTQHILDADIHTLQGLYESLRHGIAKSEKDILDCVENLIKALENKHYKKAGLSKSELFKKELTIKSAHTLSKDVQYQVEEKSDCWLLECGTNERIYEIRKLQPSACCEIKCPECDICYHTYTCTCAEYFVRNTICKHVHFIHQSSEAVTNGLDKQKSSASAGKLKKELILMTASLVDRLDEINDEDVLCTLKSQLQNSLMLLTYFSEENGSVDSLEDMEVKNGGSLKRKSMEEIDASIKKSLKG